MPRPVQRLRFWRSPQALLALGLGLCASLGGSLLVRHVYDDVHVQAEFDRRASGLAGSIQEALRDNLEVVEGVGAFYTAAGHVNRAAFHTFVQSLLPYHTDVRAVAWVPRVVEAERELLETAAREEGLAHFAITEQTEDGQVVRAASRAEYFPVYFIEPTTSNTTALGFDLASNPSRLAVLARARDTGQMVVSAAMALVQESRARVSVLVCLPLYARWVRGAFSVDERRMLLRGFVLLVLNMDAALRAASQPADYTGVRAVLYDVDTSTGEQVLASTLDTAPGAPAGWSQAFRLADRHWRLDVYLDPTAPWAHPVPNMAWGAVLLGLASTGVLVSSFRASACHTASVLQAHHTLYDREAQLRQVIETALDAVIGMDSQGRITAWNPAAETILGWPATEIIGQELAAMLIPPQYRQTYNAALQHFLVTGESQVFHRRFETSALHRAGHELPVELSIVPRSTETGYVFTAFLRDITSRRLAEQLLLDQAQVAALETAVSTATASSDTVPVLLQHCTTALVQRLGAALARIWLLHPSDGILELQASAGLSTRLDGTHSRVPIGQWKIGLIAQERQPLLSNAVTTDPRIRDQEWARREGLVSFAGYPLLDGTRLVGVIAMFARHPLSAFTLQALEAVASKITLGIERRQAEEHLRSMNVVLAQRVVERTAALSAANRELAKAARLKDEFLASMSHELRTPLNAILGLSEALEEQVYGPMNERQLHSLHSITESGRHLLELMNDILDLSKIEAGKVDLQWAVVAVDMVCQDSLRLIQEAAQKKQLQVRYVCEQTVQTLMADERRLKQMLLNLLSNAVKFTPDGGTIGLEVTGHVETQEVHCTVWDTGIGIAAAEQERLFQPFVQLDSSLVRQHAGTGLGLSLVARLAKLHGGDALWPPFPACGRRFAPHTARRRRRSNERARL